VICALIPEPMDAVSLFYVEFGPTSDEEVKSLMSQASKNSSQSRTPSGSER